MAEYKTFIPAAWAEFAAKCKALFPFLKKTFIGTRAEWDALTIEEKQNYDKADITDDLAGGELIVSDAVTAGDLNPVTSNAVAQTHKWFVASTTRTLTRDVTAGDVYIWLLGEAYLAFVSYTASKWWTNVLVGTVTITTDGDAVTVTTEQPKAMLAIIAKGRIL